MGMERLIGELGAPAAEVPVTLVIGWMAMAVSPRMVSGRTVAMVIQTFPYLRFYSGRSTGGSSPPCRFSSLEHGFGIGIPVGHAL